MRIHGIAQAIRVVAALGVGLVVAGWGLMHFAAEQQRAVTATALVWTDGYSEPTVSKEAWARFDQDVADWAAAKAEWKKAHDAYDAEAKRVGSAQAFLDAAHGKGMDVPAPWPPPEPAKPGPDGTQWTMLPSSWLYTGGIGSMVIGAMLVVAAFPRPRDLRLAAPSQERPLTEGGSS